MEWWWLLVFAPLYSIWQALHEAWRRLLEAESEAERQQIMTQAGARAFLNTALAVGMALAPWPYKLLGLVPWLWGLLASFIGCISNARRITRSKSACES